MGISETVRLRADCRHVPGKYGVGDSVARMSVVQQSVHLECNLILMGQMCMFFRLFFQHLFLKEDLF